MNFIRILKIIMNFSKRRPKIKKNLQNISNDEFVVKNNYGVEKEFLLMQRITTTIYFIPTNYKKGVFKLNELPCLVYSVEDFKKLSLKEKQKLFNENSFWYNIEDNALSNNFITLYDENNIGIDNIEISYIDIENRKGILNRVSFPNSKNFFQHFEQNKTAIDNIVKKLSKEAANSILEFIKKEVKKEEIFRMFLEYYGDSENIDILFTIGTKKDYNNISKKYLTQEYLDSFGYTFDKMEEHIKNNPGNYSKKFTVGNIDEINSYYCSFIECGIKIEGPHTEEEYNNFLHLIGLSIKKILEKKIDKFNLSDDFDFLEPKI